VVRAGQPFGLDLWSLSDSGYLYVDQYVDGYRTHSRAVVVSGHRARLELTAPPRPGLFRVQVTDDFSNPGTGIVARTLYAAPAGTGLRDALPAVARAIRARLPVGEVGTRRHLDWLLSHDAFSRPGYAPERAAAYLLSRLDHLHYRSAWLADTTHADRRELARRKSHLQLIFIIGLGLTALLLLAVVIPLIHTNLRLSRRGSIERDALMAEFEATATADQLGADRHADGGELITDLRHVREDAQQLDRLRHRLQIGLVVFVILATITAIVGLLLRLSWGWG
jgi:hypothetical protein